MAQLLLRLSRSEDGRTLVLPIPLLESLSSWLCKGCRWPCVWSTPTEGESCFWKADLGKKHLMRRGSNRWDVSWKNYDSNLHFVYSPFLYSKLAKSPGSYSRCPFPIHRRWWWIWFLPLACWRRKSWTFFRVLYSLVSESYSYRDNIGFCHANVCCHVVSIFVGIFTTTEIGSHWSHGLKQTNHRTTGEIHLIDRSKGGILCYV